MIVQRCVIILAIFCIASAGAQQSVELDDPSGDVQGSASEQAAFIDLRNTLIELTEEGIDVTFTLESLSNDQSTGGFVAYYWTEFGFRADQFRVNIEHQSDKNPPEGNPAIYAETTAQVLRLDSTTWNILATGTATIEGNSIHAAFPLTAIVDSQDFSPSAGQLIDITQVGSFWSTSTASPYRDDATGSTAGHHQDTTESTTKLAIPGASGDLSVATSEPIRFSNGEASTFHWPIELTNHANEATQATLNFEANGALETRSPNSVHLEPGQTRIIDAYVTVPFAHGHGTSQEFKFTAETPSETILLELGITYPEIPQPAGHHSTTWLHGATGGTNQRGIDNSFDGTWINAKEEDLTSTAQHLIPDDDTITCIADPSGENSVGLEWFFPVKPNLRIGLDGQMNETGTASVVLESEHLIPEGTVYALAFLYNETINGEPEPYDYGASIAEYPYSTGVPVAQQNAGSIALDLPFTLPPALDSVPPSDTQNLGFKILFCYPQGSYTAGGQAGLVRNQNLEGVGLAIQPGGTIDWPLNEYHDVIEIPVQEGLVPLTVDDAARVAAPGATVLWTVTAALGGQFNDFDVTAFGVDAKHATIHSATTLQSGQTHEIHVSIAVPEDYADGQVATFVVEVVDKGDPANASGIRLSVTVEDDAEFDDSDVVRNLSGQEEATPAAAAFIPLLAALLIIRQRQE